VGLGFLAPGNDVGFFFFRQDQALGFSGSSSAVFN